MNKIEAYDFLEQARYLKDNIEASFLHLGQLLLKIRDEELWQSSFESFREYLEDIKVNQSVATRLISVYKTFVLDWQIDETRLLEAGGWSNAYEVLSLAKTKEEAEDLIDKIAPLNSTDKRIILREKKTGVSSDECEHINTYRIEICSDCGRKVRDYDRD